MVTNSKGRVVGPDEPSAGLHRHPAIDWLKAAAIVAVVVTHSGSGGFPDMPGFTGWDRLFAYGLAAFHVPCLLMISGYLYHSEVPLGWREVARRLGRILPPYLVASLVVMALMPLRAPTFAAIAVALASANALTIYYYVFLLTFCVVTLPVVSRLSRRALQAVVGMLLAALVATCVFPALILSIDFFWSMRNPIESFALGYFLIGWLAAMPSGSGSREKHLRDFLPTLVVASAWPICVIAGSPYPLILLAKIPYALAVWRTAWWRFDARPAPAMVLHLSESSYGVFLYHYLAQEPFRLLLVDWPAGLRMGILFSTGLMGAVAFGALVRRVVGAGAARRWFGF